MKSMSAIFNRLSGDIDKVISIIVVLMMISLSALLGVGVFFRYILNNSIYWSGEVSRYLLVWLSFLGSAVAYKRGSHIGIDLFGSHFPSAKKIIRYLILAAMLLFWIVILVESIKLEQLYYYQKTSTLNIPFSFPFAALPVAALIWIIHIISDILKDIVKS